MDPDPDPDPDTINPDPHHWFIPWTKNEIKYYEYGKPMKSIKDETGKQGKEKEKKGDFDCRNEGLYRTP